MSNLADIRVDLTETLAGFRKATQPCSRMVIGSCNQVETSMPVDSLEAKRPSGKDDTEARQALLGDFLGQPLAVNRPTEKTTKESDARPEKGKGASADDSNKEFK